MKKHEEMMILPAAERRDFFRKAYSIELGKGHTRAALVGRPYQWPIEQLEEMVSKAMAELEKRRMISGASIEAVLKYFQIKTQKELWVFLGVSK